MERGTFTVQWETWLFRRSPAGLVAAACVTAIGIAMVASKLGVSFATLFFLPVLVVGWCGGVWAGVCAAVLCAALPMLLDESATTDAYAGAAVGVHCVALLGAAWLAARAKVIAMELKLAVEKRGACLARARKDCSHQQWLLEAVLNRSPELFCICDSEFRIHAISGHWRARFGDQEPVGRRFAEYVHPDDVGRAVLAFRNSAEIDEPFSFVARICLSESVQRKFTFSVRSESNRHLFFLRLKPLAPIVMPPVDNIAAM